MFKAFGKFLARNKKREKGRRHCSQTSINERQHSMPLLYALARSWAWEAVTFRCKTHPHEVSEAFIDELGETILHWACLGKPPVDSILAILQVRPEMAQARNRKGQLPLHVAISYRASADVVRALLEAYPSSAKIPNGSGSYPIHLLCDYGSSIDSLRALLETRAGASSITIQDRASGLTPLHILHARKNFPEWRRAIKTMEATRRKQQEIRREMRLGHSSAAATSSDTVSQDTALITSRVDSSAVLQRQERMIASFQQNDHWQKAALLVLVEYTKKPLTEEGLVDDECGSIVHACAGIGHCPHSLLKFAILLHADDLLEKRDTRGRLPLHVAAATHATMLISRSMEGCTAEEDDTIKADEEVLLTLVGECPEAACVSDDAGDLPFAVAIKVQRQQWKPNAIAWSRAGLPRLLLANPSALETLNLDQRLYPYVWASRMGSTADEVYRSIRRNPNLFQPSTRTDCQVIET